MPAPGALVDIPHFVEQLAVVSDFGAQLARREKPSDLGSDAAQLSGDYEEFASSVCHRAGAAWRGSPSAQKSVSRVARQKARGPGSATGWGA